VKIYPNYLSTDDDIRQMLEGARLLRQMSSTPALAEIIEQETRPGPAVQTDEEFITDIRRRADTVYHPSCTCMMGSDPKTAVVDAQCRVYGVDRLRVVDASIFPTVTSGNTNGPTIMVAEKASDMILG
jgi:choline dehydrogenase